VPRIVTILVIERQPIAGGRGESRLPMTAGQSICPTSPLWRNGFPDDLFTGPRHTKPLFRHGLTPE
jgi:hypothetical protein